MATMYHVKSARERAVTKGAHFDLEEEKVLADWIEEVVEEETRFDQSLFEWLQNGQVLCQLVNKIRPNSVKVNTQLAMKVKKDNINNFVLFCVTLGINKEDMFEPEDLLDMNNTAKVVHGLYRFSSIIARVNPQYAGPTLQLPGLFAAYYRGHFKEEAGVGDIHKRFAAFQARAPKVAGPPGMGVPQGHWNEFYRQNFKGGGMNAVYKRFGVAISEPAKTAKGPPTAGVSKGEWPSYYVQHFKGGSMSAAHARFGVVLAKPVGSPPGQPSGFLPSMGSFGGPVGQFGGVHSPRVR